jgi:fatty acid-binding protein DegV
MRTIVVTDSSGKHPGAGSDPRVADRLVVVSITVLLADRERTDATTDVRAVLDALDEGGPVKTRAPSAIEYLDAVEGGAADAAVIITPAADITTMWRHASNAVYVSERPAAVVDSRSASVGHSLVVEAAVQAALAEGTLTDVVHAARDAVRRLRFVAALSPIDTIERSGVLPSPKLQRARSTTRRAVFELRDGKIEVTSMVPSSDDIVDALVDAWRGPSEQRAAPMVGFTVDEHDAATALSRAVGADGRMVPFSPAMTAHTGPGALALAWLADD